MKILVDLAAETYSQGNRFNACLLYDSKTDKILLTCCDNTKRVNYNIKHCIINLMEEYSKGFVNFLFF